MSSTESATGTLTVPPAFAAPSASPSRRSCWIVFGLFLAVALTFAISTQHVWEDFYIAYRTSKNLATGHGLTYGDGQRVQSFTSPLGVLLPAAARLATGNSSDSVALWLYRLMGCSAYAGAGVFLWQLARRRSTRLYPAIFLVALFATDAKIVDFAVNGMETPFLLLFLAWTLYGLFCAPVRRSVHLGLAWAGLMWSRPDSFIYIGALGLGVFLFAPFPPESGGRKALLRDFLVAGAITTALYGPWLIWAWWYFGSPIPQTVVAKRFMSQPTTLHNALTWLWDYPLKLAQNRASLGLTFMPPYGQNSGWPEWAIRISSYLSLVVVVVWLVPLIRWEARVTSFVFTLGYFYLNYIANFPAPWYIPTVTVLAFVTLAMVVDQVLGAWTRRGDHSRARRSWPVVAPTLLLPLCALLLLIATGIQMGLTQRINETGNRRVLGEWLKSQAATPHDTVFLECLGYIGFFSDLRMYDWPGLCSPEVAAVLRKTKTVGNYVDYFPELISALQPDWVVLRSSEVEGVDAVDHYLLKRYYSLVKVFETRSKIDAISFLPGRKHLSFDSHFEVYHRRPPPAGYASLPDHVPVRVLPITVASLISKQTWAGPAYDSKGYIAAHAPSHLTVKIPPGTDAISGQFGFFSGAYTNPPNATPGGVFKINAIASDGTKTELYSRALDPTGHPADRGDQPFLAQLRGSHAVLAEFITEPPPGKGNAFGWTYWTDLKFEIPRR